MSQVESRRSKVKTLVDWRNAAAFTPEIKELLIATGFLRQASDVTYAAELNTSDIRHQVLFDTVQIVTSNLMGLTVHCAQCHSHKFDPISQADYYRLAAFFAPAYDPQNWKHSNGTTWPRTHSAAPIPAGGATRKTHRIGGHISNVTETGSFTRAPSAGSNTRPRSFSTAPAIICAHA